jgi:hypothetical protein
MTNNPFALTALLALLAASCATGAGGGAADPVVQAGLAANASFARERFVEKGLQAIEAAAREGREVRRLLVSAFVPGDLPAFELEKKRDGTVTLALARGGAVMQRIAVPAETWARLAALDAEVYAPPPPRAPVMAANRTVSCHGTGAMFESASRGTVRSAGAHQCANAVSPFNAARREAMTILVDLALAARPGCGRKPGEDVDWPLSRCFAPTAG